MSHRGQPVTKVIKERRRKAAEAMKAEYDALSLEEKIAKLPPPPGAAKQRARLEALLAAKANGEATESKPKVSKPRKPKKDSE